MFSWTNTRTISSVKIIHIGISERTACDSIAANTNARIISITYYRVAIGQTYLATGPIILKISKSMASVTVGSSSPTYKEAEGEGI